MNDKVCIYFDNCNYAKVSGRDCSDFEPCETFRTIQRYGQHIGLDTMQAEDVSRLEREVGE